MPQKVRLSPKTYEGILKVIAPYKGQNIKFYLFGSRTDLSKRGGDIDILVLVPCGWNEEKRFNLKLEILKSLYKTLGERKIDLIVLEDCDKRKDQFLEGAVEL